MLPFILFLTLIQSALFSSPSCAATPRPVFVRIISLYPAHTENLMALGAQEELIGIATSDTYPPQVLDKPRFSYRDNAEKFIAARPDLVLIRPMIARAAPQLITQLRNAGITVISIQPRTIDEMYDYWLRLGRLTGRIGAAREMIRTFKGGLAMNASEVELIPERDRPGVYFESMHTKMKTFAPSSIALFVLKEAGGRNIATDAVARKNSNIASYGKERILSHAGQIDIFLAQRGRMNRIEKKGILEEPGFQAIKAVRRGQVFLVDEELVSRPTQRILSGIARVRGILFANMRSGN